MVRPERRAALRDALADLRRYRERYPQDAFLADRDAQRMVLQAQYTAVQAMIDEAREVCRERGIPTDGSYSDAPLALGRAGVLDRGLAGRLSSWASFRNVLAHFYPVIDLRRVHEALGEIGDLEDFQRWLEAGDTQ